MCNDVQMLIPFVVQKLPKNYSWTIFFSTCLHLTLAEKLGKLFDDEKYGPTHLWRLSEVIDVLIDDGIYDEV